MNTALRRAFGALVASASSAARSAAPQHRPATNLLWARCYSAPRPPAGSLGSMGDGAASVRPGTALPEGSFPSRDQIDGDAINPPAGFSGGEGGSFIGPGVAPRGDASSLMAVPKRKVTPSRKGKRNQFKRIKFIGSVMRCIDCGRAKRPHIYCRQCSKNIYDNDMGTGVGSTTPP